MYKPKPKTTLKRSVANAVTNWFRVVLFVVALTGVFLYTRVGRPTRVEAATPATLNFQARLLTASGGIVADGCYNIQFKLYDAASGGSNVWTETRIDTDGPTGGATNCPTPVSGNDYRVSVKSGYVSVYLGDITSLSSLDWSKQYWLTMNVGGTTQTATPTYDGEMSPRLRLTSVPFAQAAGSLATYNSGTGFTSTLSILQPTGGNQTFQIPDQGAAGTYSLLTSNAANAAYIQNQNSADQTADLRISGTARANTSVLTPLLDTATNVALNIGTTNATAINLNQNTTIASTKTLTVTAGATTLTGASGGSATALTVNSGATTNVGAVIKAIASQTADLFQVQNSSGSVLTRISAAGVIGSTDTNTASTNSANTVIRSGNASGSSSNSGNLTLDVGTATGTTGTISIGTTSASGITIGQSGATTTINSKQLTNNGSTLNTAFAISDKPSGGNIGTAAATVDIYTTFDINQTTASQTLTLPNPTTTTSGRMVYVNNVGSASFTMYGSVISAGKSNAFIWNGSTWVTTVSLSGSVVNAIGTIDSQTKSADGAVISTSAIYLQTADATYPGLVSTGAQTFAGNKTFNGSVLTSTLDTASATTLSVGTSTASAISIGKSGVATTVNGTLTVSQAITATTLGTANTSTYLCRNSSNQIATCNTTGTGAAFVQGGNSFGALAQLGTTDTNNLQVITNSVGRALFDQSNNLYLGNANVTGGTNAAPNAFALQGTGSSTAGTAGGALTINGGAGATTGAGSTGGILTLQGGNAGGTDIAGANLVLNGGRGTGTGVGGNIVFQYAPAGSTGSTANTLQTACTISGTNGSLSCPGAGASSERFGSGSTAAGASSLAVGNAASASGTGNIAIGASTSSTGANNTISIGNNIANAGSGSVVIGMGSTASSSGGTTGIGDQVTVSAWKAIAIGQLANSSFQDSIAIGNGATTTATGQIVFGSGTTNRSAYSTAYFGKGVVDSSPTGFTINATGSNAAGTAGAALSLQGGNAVSVLNTNGGNLQLNGGQGTGTGVGGNIVFQYAPAGSSSSTANALQTACTISGTNGSLSCPGAGTSSERFGSGSTAAGSNSLAVGNGASAANNESTAIGYSAASTGINSTALGRSATAGQDAVALGYSASAGFSNSIALGRSASTTAANQLVVGSSSAAITSAYFGNGVTAATPQGFTLQGTGSSAAGTAGAAFTINGGAGATTGAGSTGGILTLQGGNAGGTDVAGANLALNGGRGTGTGVGGNIVFQYAPAGSSSSTNNALQTACTISGTNGSFSCPGAGTSSERFGSGSTAAGSNSLAVGNGASAAGNNSVAVGLNTSTNLRGTVVGYLSTAGQDGVSIGQNITTSGTNSVVIGSAAGASGNAAVALGAGASANFNNSIAIGGASSTTAQGQIVLGNTNYNNAYFGGVTAATPNAFTLQGTGSSTAGTAGADFTLKGGAGTTTGAGSTGGILTLQGGNAGGSNIAGANLVLNGGQGTGTGVGGNIVFQYAPAGTTGSTNNTLQTACTISGTNGSLSCPGAGSGSERFGSGATVSASNGLAIGQGASASGTAFSIAIGQSASATVSDAIALGHSASSTGSSSVAIGASSSASFGTSIAIGASSSATGNSSTALGGGAVANSNYSISIGNGATATGASQLVIGSSSAPISSAYVGNGVTAATPQNVTLQGTGSSTAGTAGADFTLKGGAGTSTTTGSAGGNLVLQGGAAGGSGNNNGGNVTINAGAKTASGTNGTISLGTSNTSAITLGASGITTTNAGALTISQLLTGNLGATISGAAISLNDSSNFNVSIAGGTSTGQVDIGTGTGVQTLNFGTGGTGAKTVTIGSSASTGTTTITSGTGGIDINTSTSGGDIAVRTGTGGSLSLSADNSINIGITSVNAITVGRTDTDAPVAVRGATTFSNTSAATNTVTIKGAASQSGDLMQLQNNSSQLLTAFDASGKLQFADGAGGAADTNLYRSAANTLKTDDALTVAGLLTGQLGATISGATTSINASSNFATNINTGTSTGAVTIGNSAAGAIAIQSASTVGITGTTTITGLSGGSSKALVVNNSTSTGNIFEAQDNGTAVLTVADGGFTDIGASLEVGAANTTGSGVCITIAGNISCNTGIDNYTSNTNTANNSYGTYTVLGVTATSGANTASDNVAVLGNTVTAGSQNFSYATGVSGLVRNATTGATSDARGIQGYVSNDTGAGTMALASALYGNVNATAAITTAAGLNIAANTGTITNNYGAWIQAQTAGTSDYGARIDAADTQTLWLSGNADNTTAAAGIAFGASRDTNLYRSAADTLKTDDSLVVGTNLSLSGSGTFTSGTGTVTLQGNTDVAATVSLATKAGTTYTTAGSANNVAISTASLYILDTSGAAQTITGIAAGRDGQQLTLVNADASLVVTISNESASSTAANRITTGTGADITIPAGSSLSLVYDSTNSRWRTVGTTATSGGGANQQLSNLSGTVAVNLALNPGTDNTLDLGSAANSWRTLYADTSVLTPSVDVASAGTLSIGNSTATAVSICNSAACDTITIGSNADADTITVGDSNDTVGINGTTTITGNTSINTSGSGTTTIGNASAGAIAIQSASTVGLTGTTTITGLTSGDALTVNNSTSTGNIFVAQDNGSAVFTIADGGNVTLAADLAVNGGDITTNQTTFNLLNTTATTVNAFGAATALNIGASSGLTVTPGGNVTFAQANNKDLAIQSSLAGGNRTTDVLTISQANDASFTNSANLLELNNADVDSTGPVANIVQSSTAAGAYALNITNSNTTATGAAINITGVAGANVRGILLGGITTGIGISNTATTTGSAINLGGALTSGNGILFNTTANGLTSGKALNISGSASGITADFSGAYINVDPSRTLTAAATRADSGNYLKLTRAETVNNASGVINITGDVANFSSNCTQTLGSCTDNSNILELQQSYASATGAVLNVGGAGTGNLATLDATNSSANGVLIDVQSSSSSQYGLKVTTNNGGSTALQVNGDGSISAGIAGTTTTVNGALTVAQLLTGQAGATISGATTSINASSNFATNINTGTSTGAVTIGNSAAGAIALQSASTIGITGTTTITGLSGGSSKALVVNNSTSTGNIFEAQDNGTAVFTIADGGNVTATQDVTVGSQLAVGSTSSIQTREVISVDETFTNTSGDSIGISNVITSNPGSASTAGIYANWNEALTTDGNAQSATLLLGARNQATHQGDGDLALLYGAYNYGNVNYLNGGGTVTLGVGDYGRFDNWGAATVTNAAGVYGESHLSSGGSIVTNNGLAAHAYNAGSGNITNNKGLYVLNELTSTGNITTNYGVDIASAVDSGAGSITDNYGINVQAQTAGTNDYGIAVGAADTQTLWLSSNANNTTAAAGIAFGSSRDTNLYRSAADTLKTDDNLNVTLDTDIGSQLAVGSGASITSNEVVSIDETYTNTSGTLRGIDNSITSNPASASSADITGTYNTVTLQGSSNYTGFIYGSVNVVSNSSTATTTYAFGSTGAVTNMSSGAITYGYGATGSAINASNGNMTWAAGVVGQVQNLGSGTITNGIGLFVPSAVNSGGGAITTNVGAWIQAQTVGATNYGLLIADMTAGSGTNYGLVVGDAKTNAVWINNNNDSTDEAGGIVFGQSKDTNLYRSAANTLKTDDNLEVGTNIYFTKESAHTLQIADSTTAATAGGALTVKAAAGSTSGTGGALTLQGGAGGTSGAGGATTVAGGAAGGGNTAGGALTLQGGAASGSGAGGNVSITGGAAAANASSTGGTVSIASGAGSTTGTGTAGSTLTINTGAGGGSNANAGGALTVQAGAGSATGAGGAITITGGAGGSTSGAGGALSLSGGAATTSGNGGAVTITGGTAVGVTTGGAVTIQGGTGLAGGAVNILAGYFGDTSAALNIGTVGSSTKSSTVNIANTSSGTSTQTVSIGSTANTANSVTLSAGATGYVNLNTGQAQFSEITGTRTFTVQTRTSNVAGSGLTVVAGAAGSGATGVAGGTLTLQGGAAAGTTGNANGGDVTITGGAAVNSGYQGLVNLSSTAFSTAPVQTISSTGVQAITAGNQNIYSTLPITASVSGVIATLSDPGQNVIGRILYVTARSGSNDFTLRLNSARTPIDITMKANSTATLIWNGTDWTAAGASSSTDLQAAYNNTVSSAGGAELILNAPGGNADGLTIRNNATTPITGGLLEVQTSIGGNLFSVNNNATEYATNGGGETSGTSSCTSGFPASTWTTAPAGGTCSRTTTSGTYTTGQAAAAVTTTGTQYHGLSNQLSTTMTAGLRYTVSFTVKGSANFTALEAVYSANGTATAGQVRSCFFGTPTLTGTAGSQTTTTITGSNFTASMVGSVIVFANGQSAYITGYTNSTTLTTSAAFSQTVTSQNYSIYTNTITTNQSTWTRVTCDFIAPSGATSSNAIFIRQNDSTARTFYVDNLSVTVNASVNHAADGSVDSALSPNWVASGGSVTLDSTNIYDTSGAVSVTTGATNRGVYNFMGTNGITPTVSATGVQYRASFYVKGNSGSVTLTNSSVYYSPDGGTTVRNCNDLNTATVGTSSYTLVSCIFTTNNTAASAPRFYILNTSNTSFFVDALTITLNTNTANNVQIGGANNGGPITLFTLDRSAGAPIAANNDAYLGSMYFDTATNSIQCYGTSGWGACGAAPDNIVNLNPEYAGAVLNGSGVGTMTADFCANQSGVLSVNTSICTTSGDARNYYKWTSPQATQQTYSIYVTYQLPSTFKSFASDNTVQLTGRVDNTTNAAVTYEMFKNQSGTVQQCGTETTVTTSNNTWQTVGINGNEATGTGGCSFNTSSASSFVIFKINMKANSGANAYASTLSFTTKGQ